MADPKFSVVPRELTHRTTVWDILLDGEAVAQAGREDSANKIAECFQARRVFRLADYRALPNLVRTAFISATCQAEPRLPR